MTGVVTVAPFTIYPLFERLGLNVSTYSSFWVLISSCIEDSISVLMAYLECVLLGTVISVVRAARHIPKLNKDYILILGCQIREDGGLT